DRSFAIAARPVTAEQFRGFSPTFRLMRPYAQTSWYDAAAYCNWLSDREGIPRDQWCYEATAERRVTGLRKGYLHLTGYRLAAEAGWEDAYRAGARTADCYGGGVFRSGGLRLVWGNKPNDLGLSDLYGSHSSCWCMDRYKGWQGDKEVILEDQEDH